ncbi:MAG: DNA cytosine methyltransferase [Desulfobulbaceae bacterium]|nr:DNA cytosine methyltransferase [Desulfobulbaceae bacterium]
MTRALQRGLFDEMIVDNFAGGGGASTGIEIALGRPIDVAINHDQEAVAMHQANHPYTRHLCEDVWAVDPVAVTCGRPVGLAWFSPDCKHFSKAKGGKPVSRRVRGLAWVVIRWAQKVRPRVIMLENVEEFAGWGPLVPVCDKRGRKKIGPDGKTLLRPCGYNEGATFYRWVGRLESLGYTVEWRQLRACDYGAPTIRKRLFLIARCDGLPIVWPEPTHGDPKSDEVRSGRLLPWRTAAECIEWSVPAPSIFERQRPLAEATMRRIAKGIVRYVIDNPEPFIVPLTHHGERRAHAISEPLPTVTAAHRGEFAMVAPVMTEHANASSPRCMPSDEPLRTICAATKGGHHALVTAFMAQHNGGFYDGAGRAVDAPLSTVTHRGTQQGLVTANLMRQFGKSVGSAATDPVGTITAGGGGKTGLVTSHLVKLRGTCRDGQPVTAPMPTVTASGTHVGEVRAFLLKYYGSDQDPQIREPLHTITTKDRFGLVTVHGQPYRIVDIGMRMLAPRELYRAQGFSDSYVIDPDVNGKPLTKTAQVRMCGNSVSPPPVTELVRANVKLQCQVAA